ATVVERRPFVGRCCTCARGAARDSRPLTRVVRFPTLVACTRGGSGSARSCYTSGVGRHVDRNRLALPVCARPNQRLEDLRSRAGVLHWAQDDAIRTQFRRLLPLRIEHATLTGHIVVPCRVEDRD